MDTRPRRYGNVGEAERNQRLFKENGHAGLQRASRLDWLDGESS